MLLSVEKESVESSVIPSFSCQVKLRESKKVKMGIYERICFKIFN